jgi:hypothetical protein
VKKKKKKERKEKDTASLPSPIRAVAMQWCMSCFWSRSHQNLAKSAKIL